MTKEEFMKKYAGENVAVHCDTEEKANEFLKLADKMGFVWRDDEKLTDLNCWKEHKQNTCYECSISQTTTYADVDYFKRNDYTIVEFEHQEQEESIIYEDIAPNKKGNIHLEICTLLNEIYKKKNHDYGDSFSKLRNELPNAILVRVYDKYSRLKTLMQGAEQQVKDESIDDTLMDLANYCIMELIERKIENENK